MRCRNYAHRGFSGRYPENTMLAFQKALEAGCEGMEFDVQLSRDGQVVIIHDERVDRTSDCRGSVREYTLSQLRQMDFSAGYRGQVPVQRIPTLQEYFELVRDRDIISNIELKTGVYEYPGIEEKVDKLIRQYHMEDRVILSSFNHHSILRMQAIHPELQYGFLSETWILNAGAYTAGHGVQAYHPHLAMVTEQEAADLKAHGVQINTWTVNEEADSLRMIRMDVDGIIGNFPDRTKALLYRQGLRP